MRNFLILLLYFTFNGMISQEIIGMKEVYNDHKLVYKSSNDDLFTGIIQSKRKNGHLVYDEEYKNGVILSSNLYFNGKEKRISTKTIYNPNKPLVLSKKYEYNLKGEIYETTTYNGDGVKTIVEQFKNGILIYSCEYLGKKKNGIEIGYAEDGEEMTYYCEYTNGKKNGIEHCIKKGIETKTEYRSGKKIK